MPPRTQVVITGLGLVLASGAGRGAAEPIFAGRSFVTYLRELPGLPRASGAPVRHFAAPRGTEAADRAVQFAAAAADEAWQEAGLGAAGLDPARVGVALPLSKGGMGALADWADGARPGTVPFFATVGEKGDCPSSRATPDAATRLVAARLGVTGPIVVPVTACASGGHALVWGARLIQRGIADAVIAGAAEASLEPLVLGSYRRLGLLADPGEAPEESVRPFSRTRRGFAIGEGAAAVVLESAESAGRRGAEPLAVLSAWAGGAHAASLIDVEESGATLARLMTDAMRRAGVGPASIDYVHAHGTATVSNDLAEARAIRLALGPAADRVSVSSTKGAHGHLLGAATAAEVVLTVLAIRRSEVPPTVNLTDPDPAIGLDCTPLEPRRRAIRHALKIASGFGGQSLALCLSAPGAL